LHGICEVEAPLGQCLRTLGEVEGDDYLVIVFTNTIFYKDYLGDATPV
jgi:hypothetical protein